MADWESRGDIAQARLAIRRVRRYHPRRTRTGQPLARDPHPAGPSRIGRRSKRARWTLNSPRSRCARVGRPRRRPPPPRTRLSPPCCLQPWRPPTTRPSLSLFLPLAALARPASEHCTDNNNEVIALETPADFSYLPEPDQLVFPPTYFKVGSDGVEDLEELIYWDEELLLPLDDSMYFEDWKTEVVKQHNAYRARYGAPPLTWSGALYPATQQWANQCKFQHRCVGSA